MVTLKDIAEEAHVSLMTVSNVVNGNLSKVSKEKYKEIQEILKRRNYVQNANARSLARSNSNIIAVMLRSIGDENSLSSPHNANLVGSVIRHIQDLGYYAMVNFVENCRDITTCIKAWNVQAAIFLGMFDDEIEQIYELSNIPVVFIDSYSKVRQLSNVGINDYRGGQLAAEHFIENGHRNMAFVSPTIHGNGVVQHRYQGFVDTLTRNNLFLSANHCFSLTSDADPDEINRIIQGLINCIDEISAVFVTSDRLAASVMSGLHQHGIRIPEDVSFIGFDNTMNSTQTYPQLTTIDQDLKLKAKLAVDILSSQLQHPESFAESRVIDVTLIPRNSVKKLQA